MNNLNADRDYRITVTATNAIGSSIGSEITCTTQPRATVSAECESESTNSLSVKWKLENTDASVYDKYSIEYYPEGNPAARKTQETLKSTNPALFTNNGE